MLILKNAFFVMMGLFFSAGIALAEESMPHAEEAAHQGGGLPQFDPTSWPSQIFWLVVFFVILYTIFSKSVLPSIGTTLGNRKAHIDRHIAEAETLSKEAEIIDSELKAALREAGQSASSEIQSAESDAKTRLADAIAGFRDRYEKEIGDAENRIQKATDIALQDMNSLVATLATQMAEKVAGISADATQAETVVRSLSNKASKAA